MSQRLPDYDLYAVLGVEPTATKAEIKQAVRRLSKEWHPDSNSSPDAAERMVEINEARRVLLDDWLRSEYDKRRTSSTERSARAIPRVQPENVDFGALSPDDRPAKRVVRVFSDGGWPSKVQLRPTAGAFWRQSGAEVPEDEDAVVDFILQASAEPGATAGVLSDRAEVIFDDSSSAVLTLRVNLRVGAPRGKATPPPPRTSTHGAGSPGHPPPPPAPPIASPAGRRSSPWLLVAGIAGVMLLIGVLVSATHGGSGGAATVDAAAQQPGVKWAIKGSRYASSNYSATGDPNYDYVDLLNTDNSFNLASEPAFYTWATPTRFLSLVGPKITALDLSTGRQVWTSDGSSLDPYKDAKPVGVSEGSLWTRGGWSVDLSSGLITNHSLSCAGISAGVDAIKGSFVVADNGPNDGWCVYKLPTLEKIRTLYLAGQWAALLTDGRVLVPHVRPTRQQSWAFQPVFQVASASGQKLWETALPEPKEVMGHWQTFDTSLLYVADDARNLLVQVWYSDVPPLDFRYLIDLDPRTGRVLWTQRMFDDSVTAAQRLDQHRWVLQVGYTTGGDRVRFFLLDDRNGGIVPILLPPGWRGDHLLGVNAAQSSVLVAGYDRSGIYEVAKFRIGAGHAQPWYAPDPDPSDAGDAPIVEGLTGSTAVVLLNDQVLEAVRW